MINKFSPFKPHNWKQKVIYWLARLLKETKVLEPIVAEVRHEHIAFERVWVSKIFDEREYLRNGFEQWMIKDMFREMGEELAKHPEMYNLSFQDEMRYGGYDGFLKQKLVTLQISVVKPGEEQRRMVFREEKSNRY